LIQARARRRDRNSSATSMRASKVPNALRIFSARAVRDGADEFAEAIRLTMYHRILTVYENFDVL